MVGVPSLQIPIHINGRSERIFGDKKNFSQSTLFE